MKKKNIIDELSIKMMSKTNENFDVSDEELIRAIKSLPDINMPGRDGRTLLIHAAVYGRIDTLKWLSENGANAEQQDELGYTALHAAVASNHYEAAKILISNHAPVNAQDLYGNTPLFRASHLHPEMVQLLMNSGANCHIKNSAGISPYMTFEAYPEIIKIMEAME